MGELENLISENTKAVHRNTNEMGNLIAETKAYRETSEKALDFQKGLIKQMLKHEQEMQSRILAAAIKWGGWIIGILVALGEVIVRIIPGVG